MSSPILISKRLFSISLGLITGLWIFQGLAQEPATPPISITSEHMMVRNLENHVVFEGNVHVQKEDFQMDADQMTVNFASGGRGDTLPADALQTNRSVTEKRSVSTIDASGHVKIIKGDRRATSQIAVYDQVAEKVTLTGNPVSWEKDYKVSGTKITIFLKENRSLVEGSSVLIQP
ncbi:MAG TPA: LptA/OstA family protein [Nitrospiria bacterium]|jgi:lipopolysaccharide export system protein LptA|nr:LptA/OstA family protein [Nitrospiria bacterium]